MKMPRKLLWPVIVGLMVAFIVFGWLAPAGDEDAEDAPIKWVCPKGFKWSGSKEKGKECKGPDGKLSGTIKTGGSQDWVCPSGFTWTGSREKGKECKKITNNKILSGTVRKSGAAGSGSSGGSGGSGASCDSSQNTEGPMLGGSGGKHYAYHWCPNNGWITSFKVGYDEKVHEIKYLAAACSDGSTKWIEGRNAPSSVWKTILNVLAPITLAIPETTAVKSMQFGNESGYDSAQWTSDGGFDQVAYISNVNSGGINKAAFMRAFGTNKDDMFGVNKNSTGTKDISDSDKKVWKCSDSGKLCPGKKFRIVGVETHSGDGLDRAKFVCRQF